MRNNNTLLLFITGFLIVLFLNSACKGNESEEVKASGPARLANIYFENFASIDLNYSYNPYKGIY